MGDRTKIEWTDASWTPIRAAREMGEGATKLGWHCEHMSEGCRNCYAEVINRRLGTGLDFKPGHRDDVEIYIEDKLLTQPLRWKRPRMVFVCSMTDIFADFVPDDFIDQMFAVMALSPQHTFQILTKRPERMRAYFTQDDGFGRWGYIEGRARLLAKVSPGKTLANFGGRNLPNVWLGISCEDQYSADRRIPYLLATPAVTRFLSCEPLLGPIDLSMIRAPYWARTQQTNCLTGEANPSLRDHPGIGNKIGWVIVGGESGPEARPMHPGWARALRDQCKTAGTPFLFKQWGQWAEYPCGDGPAEIVGIDPEIAEHDCAFDNSRAALMVKVGKKAAGRLLDGVEHSAFP